MHEAHEIVEQGTPSELLELPFDIRQKSRFSATLESGEAIGVFLPRGTLLRHGSLVKTSLGVIVQVRAAPEAVSTVSSDDTHLLMRVAYHLGNRHVALQIAPSFVRYQHDHVLDDMVSGLGGEPRFEHAAFEPEGGAYGGHSHSHSHSHDIDSSNQSLLNLKSRP